MEATDNFFLPPFVGTAVVKILLLFWTQTCVFKKFFCQVLLLPLHTKEASKWASIHDEKVMIYGTKIMRWRIQKSKDLLGFSVKKSQVQSLELMLTTCILSCFLGNFFFTTWLGAMIVSTTVWKKKVQVGFTPQLISHQFANKKKRWRRRGAEPSNSWLFNLQD